MAGMSDAQPLPQAGGLSALEAAILEFEGTWWSAPGGKESEIRARFDLSAPRYYQVLNGLIDNPAALAAQPLLVKRLRRLRQRRHENRSARHLSGR